MVFGNLARRLAGNVTKTQVMAGIGVVGAALAGAAYAAPAENSCKQSIKQAYRRFMPMNDYPDLSKHNNCMANVLTPQLYAKLRDVVRIFVCLSMW